MGHEESNRSRLAPALPAERHGERRGHPSRVSSGSLRSPLTGPGRAAGKHSADKREGQALVRPHGRGHTAVMDAEARNQYLRDLREEYCLAPKSVKSRLLDEAAKRTGLARKVIIRKLAQLRHESAHRAAKSFRINSGYCRVCTTLAIEFEVLGEVESELAQEFLLFG